MPGTQPSDDNIALIGGVVGGVVALLIVVGVIAFIVSRNRRKVANNQPRVQQNDVSMAPAQASASNYGRISTRPASSHYDESF
jgi:predicted lipid-binding transport protein (Tim44 family)